MGIQCLFAYSIGIIIGNHDRHRIHGSMKCDDFQDIGPQKIYEEVIDDGCAIVIQAVDAEDVPESVRFHVDFSSDCPEFRIESWHFSLSSPSASSLAAFDPTGFGAVKSYKFNAWLPAMQFSGLFTTAGCLYLGINDGKAFPKTFAFDGKDTVQAEYLASPEMGAWDSLPFKVRAIEGICDWHTLADQYVPFARQTEWYKRGLSLRMSRPEWIYSTPLWINTHWQTVDVFEPTGGHPRTVLERVNKFKALIGDCPMLLHWYEWDLLGYTDSEYSECEQNHVCGFDSHYPDYFPAREGFQQAVSELADINVRTIPYINGRIFDQALEHWDDPLVQSAAVLTKSQRFVVEEYGNHVRFAAMCPAAKFWQQTIADVAQGVVETAPVSGVYIDQIAAAPPLHCYNKNHSHEYGGGSSWTSGYKGMLEKVRKQIGDSHMIVTESNAEQFIGSVDTFLSLIAMFDVDHLVPAFQYIYPGGVFASAGAEFYRSDITNNDGLGFMKKVMKQFVIGSQLGWFSLGGRDNQVPPMDMLDVLTDPKHRELISAFQDLVQMRQDPFIWRVFAFGGLIMDLNGDGSIWGDSNGGLIIACNPKLALLSIYINVDLTGKLGPASVDMYRFNAGEWELIRQGESVSRIRIGIELSPRSCSIIRLSSSKQSDVIPQVNEF